MDNIKPNLRGITLKEQLEKRRMLPAPLKNMKTKKELEKEIEELFYPEIVEGKIPIMKKERERKDIWDKIIIKGYKKCYVYNCKNDAEFTVMSKKGKPRKSYCKEHKEIIYKTFKTSLRFLSEEKKEKYKKLKTQFQTLKDVLGLIDEVCPCEQPMMDCGSQECGTCNNCRIRKELKAKIQG